MTTRAKYIITRGGRIIVFPEMFYHSDFKEFDPVRAGFISFRVEEGEPSLSCWGESISLGLKSDPERDTILAKRQLGLL